jgi:hypothetical protein
MDYILENVKTSEKIVITTDQKHLLDQLADTEYSPVDTKIYVINKSKYYVNVIR